ncbi:MAG TPA: hypothetical protein VIU93_01770 [Gallionellaceae bacterium]
MMIRHYFALLLFAAWSPVSLASQASTHCSKQEQVVFSCHAGKKILSLCMSKPVAGQGGYLQYRFGALGRPELIFPKALQPGAENFFYSTAGYSAGGEGRVRFSIGTYDYVLYSKITSGPPRKGGSREKYQSAGMVIRNNKKQIGSLQCAEKNSDFDFPDGYLNEESFDYDIETP